jgi:general stress protein 26
MYERVWQELCAAVTVRRHGFHTFTLATVDAHGFPQARTMVLQGADPVRRSLRFHCDARSPKVAEFRADSPVCALFYGTKEKLQVRAYGSVTIHRNDPVSEETWNAMQPMSREVYRTPFAPSRMSVASEQAPELLSLAEAYHNLVVCELILSSLESLSLSSEGHERIRFDLPADGTTPHQRLHP